MPAPLKAILSAVILLVCLALFYYDSQRPDAGAEQWVVLLLGPLMVLSIWIFPEAKTRQIRRDVAKTRADTAARDTTGADTGNER